MKRFIGGALVGGLVTVWCLTPVEYTIKVHPRHTRFYHPRMSDPPPIHKLAPVQEPTEEQLAELETH